MIQVHFSVFFLAALLILILPLDWLLAAAAASAFHELCHVLMLYLLKGRILRIQVQAGGCIIESGRIGEPQQFASILAGPLGSLCLLLFCRAFPKVAICGLLQGLYNLLPVMPLDGGRLLRLLLYRFCPKRAEWIMTWMAVGSCILLDILAIWLIRFSSDGSWPAFLAVIWNLKFLPRKIPCKPSQIKVQ